jgi:CRISPR system Cascade subunit CasE
MVRLQLDAARLARESLAARLPMQQEDLGALVHAALAGLFGEGTVQPFHVVDETARQVPILAYTQRTEAELREHAATFADPARYAACAWDELATKPMPEIETGRRLGFDLRVCPVVRLSGPLEVPGKDGEPLRYAAGVEVDAWVHRRFMAQGAESEIDREGAYTDWLRERLRGSAEVSAVRLRGFRRVRLARRTHTSPRRAKVLERPDALLRGELEVQDSKAFRELLARGVGRHRAFGFGMLLLRAPGRC